MELRELRLIVRRYLLLALAVFAICVAAGIAAAVVPEKTYRTAAVIVLDVNNTIVETGGSVQQASFVLPAIEARATSTSLRDRVSNDVPEQYRRVSVRIDASSDASVLNIRGTSSSPQAAQAWVNAIADRLVEEQAGESPVILTVLDAAPLKRQPIAPNVEPIILASIVVGLVAALFAALGVNRLRQAFDVEESIRERLGAHVLGQLPSLGRRLSGRPILVLLNGHSSSREMVAAFESIRTNLEFRMGQMSADRLAVVPLTGNSGSEAVTAGLSVALAAVGHEVVAIEANLRNPGLAEQLNVRPKGGMGDIAAFGLAGDIVLQRTELPHLSLLAAGLPAGRAADVVATTLPRVLEALDNGKRTVVVDSPPLLEAPESSLVVAKVRYVVLVVGPGSREFWNLTTAIGRVNDAGGTVIGVVINRMNTRRAPQRSVEEVVEGTEGGVPEEGERRQVPRRRDWM